MMTGTSPRGHGDRRFQPALEMPKGMPTLAGCFGAAGYQTLAIGKLHVYPKRNRIGFDEALIAEEGRGHIGGDDDYFGLYAKRLMYQGSANVPMILVRPQGMPGLPRHGGPSPRGPAGHHADPARDVRNRRARQLRGPHDGR